MPKSFIKKIKKFLEDMAFNSGADVPEDISAEEKRLLLRKMYVYSLKTVIAAKGQNLSLDDDFYFWFAENIAGWFYYKTIDLIRVKVKISVIDRVLNRISSDFCNFACACDGCDFSSENSDNLLERFEIIVLRAYKNSIRELLDEGLISFKEARKMLIYSSIDDKTRGQEEINLRKKLCNISIVKLAQQREKLRKKLVPRAAVFYIIHFIVFVSVLVLIIPVLKENYSTLILLKKIYFP